MALLLAAFAAAIVIRVHNAFAAPVLAGYDAFAHFGYIWFLAEEGRLPAATAGWQFFQPPAYYVYMLAFWEGLGSVDPLQRLRLGTAVLAALTVVPAWITLLICRRALPGAAGSASIAPSVAPIVAAVMMLFLPVHVYSAAFLGNEVLTAILCSLALAVLLWTLERASAWRCAVLGLSLGLAMLAKFTALVVAAAALGTLALQALWRREFGRGVVRVVVAGVAMLLVCGWFYGRNLAQYGNPFQMSREELFLAQVEDAQLQGERSFLEYVLFDPLIVYRPQWPRGLTLDGTRPPGTEPSALRESIPTGLYANTWFDGFGGFVAPRITESELSRRAGQVLLTLGLVPTLLMIVGFAAGIRRLRREGWDDAVVAMLLASLAMAAVMIQGTRTVPTHAAVKATYLMPVSVAFGFWLALGFDFANRRFPAAARAAAGVCVALALVSSAVFAHGLLFPDWARARRDGDARLRNLHGMIYAAAGQREQSRPLFESAAREGWPLAHENLADFALAEGRAEEALEHMQSATAAQKALLDTTIVSRRRYVEAGLAEYANTRAVIFFRLGRREEAVRAVRESRGLDAAIPETHYNFGILLLDGMAPRNAAARREREEAPLSKLRRAARSFRKAWDLDPAFREAQAMLGVTASMEGDCTRATALIRDASVERPGEHRLYPLRTGPGDQNGAALHRRRRIEPLPARLDPARHLRACGGADD